ncbi:MAG: transcription antitermination factor NusB [Thermoanaerobaculia bacterium]
MSPEGKPLAAQGSGAPANGGARSTRGVRSQAVSIVERALVSRAPVDAELAALGTAFDERDQALLREIVFGTLRWLKRLDQVLVAASGRTFEQIQPALLPVLRVAAYQLLFLDRVPAHAIVSEAVDEALRRSHKGAGGFVNAVLRRVAAKPDPAAWPVTAEDPVELLAIETSHPEALVRRWLTQYGEPVTRTLLAANNRQKPMHLLAFKEKGGRDLLAANLLAEGVETEPSRLSRQGLVVRSGNPLRTAVFARGDFYIQDEVAQLAANLPEPRPGEKVLDVAAAPGGKGLALLATEPTLRLIAADVALPRLAALSANHRRLGISSGIVAAAAELTPFTGAFDRVIVDYPCTGTGTLRKHPELKWRWSESELDRLAAQALGLLAGAAVAVAPGGFLVAISCSLEPEENESIGEEFLRLDSGFRRADSLTRIPEVAHAARSARGVWRWLPSGDHDGFTVQLFERRS